MQKDVARLSISLLLAAIFVFGLLACLRGSAVFQDFQSEVSRNYDYCHTDVKAHEHEQTKDCQGLLYKIYDDPLALFTGGLFVFTVALAIATIRLFQITRAGMVEQAEFARKTLEQSTRTADAAVSALGPEKASFVFASPTIEFLEEPELNGIPQRNGLGVKAVWNNVGGSTANNVVILKNAILINARSNNAPDIERPSLQRNNIDGVSIGANSSISSTSWRFFGNDFDEIINGRMAIAFLSIIAFTDIISPTELQQKEAIVKILRNGQIRLPNGIIAPNWDITLFEK